MNHACNPFELNISLPSWKEASIDIEAVIKVARIQVTKGIDPKVAFKEISSILHKYSYWVTKNTFRIACNLFCQGTDIDPNQFY
jgi:hypothetical protein